MSLRFLLNTNILSESLRPSPNLNIMAMLQEHEGAIANLESRAVLPQPDKVGQLPDDPETQPRRSRESVCLLNLRRS